MENIIKIRGVEIGKGMPKIAAPIVAPSRAEIAERAARMNGLPIDAVEWRADFFEGMENIGDTIEVLGDVRKAIGEKLLIFTVRTKAEGGSAQLSAADYLRLNEAAAKSGFADIIDVEMMRESAGEVISALHDAGAAALLSSHDFQKTPSEEEIIARLKKMQDMGGDILKIAVMPQSPQDVLTLISATEKMRRLHARRPLVTIAMSGLGLISRISGEIFGSAMTFGSAGGLSVASAPGQISVEELFAALCAIHKSLE
ncbi:MAG: type I 3-dehydroquinate dehydratase [Christensenellales bacterium]|jgi:3-dehydroquinate dehydratase-1